MNKYHIGSVGCERRGLDAQKLNKYLSANGLEWADEPSQADMLFVFTCGLDDKINQSIDCLSWLGSFRGKLFICGCLPITDPNLIEGFNGEIIPNNDLQNISKYFPDFKIGFDEIPDSNDELIGPGKSGKEVFSSLKYKFLSFNLFSFWNLIKGVRKPPYFDPSLFTVRISRGCKGKCSYCGIKKAIGDLVSKPFLEITKELDVALAQGRYKLNLISSDTGSYGMDISSDLPTLLNNILNQDKRITIEFIQDLHPYYICKYRDELIKIVKTGRVKGILCAIQSGSEKILGLMDRQTDLVLFKKTLFDLRKAYPNLLIGTQVIVGFPTESESDFISTLNFLKECRFDSIDVFEYDEKKGTKSASLFPKVDELTSTNRKKTILKSMPSRYASYTVENLKDSLSAFFNRFNSSFQSRTVVVKNNSNKLVK